MRVAGLVLLAAVLAQSATAGAAGPPPATRAPLISGTTSGPPLPGLPSTRSFDQLRPAPGPSPTTAQCVESWNRVGPRVTRAWLGSQRSARASVTVGSLYVGSVTIVTPHGSRPGTGGSTSGPICVLRIRRADATIVELEGPWKAGSVAAWSGNWVTATNDVQFRRTLNASVGSDGSIHLD